MRKKELFIQKSPIKIKFKNGSIYFLVENRFKKFNDRTKKVMVCQGKGSILEREERWFVKEHWRMHIKDGNR